MNARTTRRFGAAHPGAARTGALVAGAALMGGLLVAPSAALAQPAVAAPAHAEPVLAEDAAACRIADATLTWGVKESFRSYISGSIANGEWTVSDDMRYETPSFIWDEVAGDVAPELGSGSIAFTGAVHFTGHEGAMKLDIADPIIEFAEDDTAYLSLTVGSTDTADSGGEAVGESVRVAKIELDGAVEADGTALRLVDAPTRLTAEGAAAFNGEYGSYVAGEDLDPIALEASVSGCTLGAQEAAPQQEESGGTSAEGAQAETPAEPAAAEKTRIPWVPIGIGAVALLVIGVTAGMLFAGRGKGKAAPPVFDAGDPAEAPEDPTAR